MNKFLIISFKSRDATYSFSNTLKRYNILPSIINTPKSIGSTCTLSIKVGYSHLNQISLILSRNTIKSFMGLFSATQNQYGDQIVKLI